MPPNATGVPKLMAGHHRHKHPQKSHPKIALPQLPPLPHPSSVAHTAKPAKQILNPSLSNPASPKLSSNTGGGGDIFSTLEHTGEGAIIGSLLGPEGAIAGAAAGSGATNLLPDLSGVPVIGGALSTAQNLTSGASNIISWLTDPVRVIKVLGGGILLLMGLWHLTKQLSGASPARHAANLGKTVASVAAVIPK